MIYVYALTDPVEPPAGLRGFDDAPLSVLATGGVAAVHSAAPVPSPEATAAHLWCHETVAEGLMEAGAVLPARFGTTLAGVATLRALLERNQRVIRPALDRVRGLVELGVRVRRKAPEVDQPVECSPTEAGAPGARSGRDYLLRRLDQVQSERAREDRVQALARDLHAPLARVARHAQRARPAGGLVLQAAYLVTRADVPRFVDRARQLDAAHDDLEVLCTGPWPAYSFVPELDRQSPSGDAGADRDEGVPGG